LLAGAGAVAAALSLPRLARAQVDGGAGAPSCSLPTSGFKVLEIYLAGGLTPWETFYLRPDGGGNWTSWQREKAEFDMLAWGAVGGEETRAVGADSAGRTVHLGPMCRPLWDSRYSRAGQRMIDRTRVVVMRHDFVPHQLAIPYAMTGRRLGNPRMSGLGAAIAAGWGAGACPGTLPLSYVIRPSNSLLDDLTQAATMTGMYPGGARPLALHVRASGSSAEPIGALLARGGLNGPDRDALLGHYRDRYAANLHYARGDARSQAFAGYSAVLDRVRHAADLEAILSPEALAPSVTSPLDRTVGGFDQTGTALDLAARLLAPSLPTRYVSVIDNGINDDFALGYDTHDHGPERAGTGLYNTLEHLAALVRDGRIDLDTTLIFLNTEFGRTPTPPAGRPDGRDHWTEGYATALIGGPIRSGAVAGVLQDDGRASAVDGSAPAGAPRCSRPPTSSPRCCSPPAPIRWAPWRSAPAISGRTCARAHQTM
jgi:hypothetical protein